MRANIENFNSTHIRSDSSRILPLRFYDIVNRASTGNLARLSLVSALLPVTPERLLDNLIIVTLKLSEQRTWNCKSIETIRCQPRNEKAWRPISFRVTLPRRTLVSLHSRVRRDLFYGEQGEETYFALTRREMEFKTVKQIDRCINGALYSSYFSQRWRNFGQIS